MVMPTVPTSTHSEPAGASAVFWALAWVAGEPESAFLLPISHASMNIYIYIYISDARFRTDLRYVLIIFMFYPVPGAVLHTCHMLTCVSPCRVVLGRSEISPCP